MRPTVYNNYVGEEKRQVEFAIRNSDLSFAVHHLKKMKINKAYFIELCKAAMDSKNQTVLEFLLNAYYQFWGQELVNELVTYGARNKYFMYFEYLDRFVDTVNTYRKTQNEVIKDTTVQLQTAKNVEKKSLIKRISDYIDNLVTK